MPGHIRERKRQDGTKVFQARYPDPAATKPNKDILKTFGRKRDASDWLADMHAAVMRGEYIDPRLADRPFREVVAAWKDTRWGSLSPTTKARYEQVLRTHLLPKWGHTKIGAITREAVSRYFGGLARSGMAPGTVRKIHTVMSSIMAEAVELRLARTNPCARIRSLPSVRRDEMRFLTADEVRAVGEAITPHYRLVVYTAAYTGMRAGELYGLQRKDVDVLHGRIHVRRSLKLVDGRDAANGPIYGATKSGKVRTVSLPAFLRQMLIDHLAQPSPGGNGADDLVFTSRRGAPIRHNLFVRRHFRPAVKAALPLEKHGLRWHDLRHTCAALLIAAGAHPKAIQERLGHASITTTLDRYGHLFPGLDAALADALDSTYAEASAPTENVTQLQARSS